MPAISSETTGVDRVDPVADQFDEAGALRLADAQRFQIVVGCPVVDDGGVAAGPLEADPGNVHGLLAVAHQHDRHSIDYGIAAARRRYEMRTIELESRPVRRAGEMLQVPGIEGF